MSVTSACVSIYVVLDLDFRVQSCLVQFIKLGQDVLRPNNLILSVVTLELMQETYHIVVSFFKNPIFTQ